MRIPLSNDTLRRRQDEMSNQLEDTLINNLRSGKFSLQIHESTMHNISLLLAYFRYFEGHTICEEMLFIKVLPSHVTGEVLYDVTKGYFDKNNIPLVNLVQVSTDGVPAMRGQHKGFVSRKKEAAPHILTIHCIIHRQHLSAKRLGGGMEEPLNIAISLINFIKANCLREKLFRQLCEDEDNQVLIMHT